jgi:peptidoglycan/LPS O-acetylase OafA/YrhL
VRILLRTRLVLFVMAIPTALTLIPMVTPTADTPVDFIPQLRILAYYGVFSGFGWLLHRQAELVGEFGRKLWIPVLVALAVVGPLGILGDRLIRGGGAWSLGERIIALYLGGLFSWSLVVLFIGAFVKWGDEPRAWISYLSDASYWCYLVHLPIVVALQILVADLALPGALKYALVMGMTIAVCLGSYQAFVRTTFIGRTLNGPREKAAPAPVTP